MPLVLIIIVLPMAISASRRAEECGIEPAHPNQQLDEPCIRFFLANRSVPSIRIVISRPVRRAVSTLAGPQHHWQAPKTLKGRAIALLVSDGVACALIEGLRRAVHKEGARLKIVAPHHRQRAPSMPPVCVLSLLP
jgi:hypothetical protein